VHAERHLPAEIARHHSHHGQQGRRNRRSSAWWTISGQQAGGQRL
jgi:hypothetical protein